VLELREAQEGLVQPDCNSHQKPRNNHRMIDKRRLKKTKVITFFLVCVPVCVLFYSTSLMYIIVF
jgi:hypothetical protein